jgi:hypothetical protein
LKQPLPLNNTVALPGVPGRWGVPSFVTMLPEENKSYIN